MEREQSSAGAASSANLDDLFDELESLSEDSDNQHDNISVRSIRKPTLPQYFGDSETASVDTVRRESDGSVAFNNILSTVCVLYIVSRMHLVYNKLLTDYCIM